MASTMREYPTVFGDTILATYQRERQEQPDLTPKAAWKFATFLHRSHPRLRQQMEQDNLILAKRPDANLETLDLM